MRAKARAPGKAQSAEPTQSPDGKASASVAAPSVAAASERATRQQPLALAHDHSPTLRRSAETTPYPQVFPMSEQGAQDLNDIALGECAFGDEGGYVPDGERPPPTLVYGGDGSAQRLQSIMAGAARNARMVFAGCNDAEMLSMCARVAETAPGSQARPPPRNRGSHLAPAAEHQWSPRSEAGEVEWGQGDGLGDGRGHAEKWKRGDKSWSTEDWGSQCDHTRRAYTDVGAPVREPAPSFVSIAATAPASGVLGPRGLAHAGVILHVDADGRVKNEEGQQCDLHGRLTRARGVRGKGAARRHTEKWAWGGSGSDGWWGDWSGSNDWWTKDWWTPDDVKNKKDASPPRMWTVERPPPPPPAATGASSSAEWLQRSPPPPPPMPVDHRAAGAATDPGGAAATAATGAKLGDGCWAANGYSSLQWQEFFNGIKKTSPS